MELSVEDRQHIDTWVQKFPSDQPRSAVIMALRIVQDSQGHVSDESLHAVAEYLKIPAVYAFEVVSFYSMFRREPVADHVLKVCTSLSCCLAGADEVVKFAKQAITDKDCESILSVCETECLGACQGAPVMLLNDKTYHENISPKSLIALIEQVVESDHE